MTLEQLNTASSVDARDWFTHTCAATSWVNAMVDGRPYASVDALTTAASEHWQTMSDSDLLEAFSAHPMIGDLSTLRAKYAATQNLASAEQSGTAVASEDTLIALRDANKAYLEKHGFIFIICATGLSAQTMLDALNARIDNSTLQEMRNAAAEQIKITLLRINKALMPQKDMQ